MTSLLAPLAGGLLIGGAVSALLLLRGRVAGISGILAGAFAPEGDDRRWRALFLAGLVLGGLAARAVNPEATGAMIASTPVLAIAGLLVGFGTRLGAGCTSGHGVCGVSRGSLRSIAATATFMVVAGVVVLFVRHGGAR